MKEVMNIVKRMRKMRREEEIKMFLHSINYNRVEKSDKIYSRKEKHKKQLNNFE